MRYTKVLRWWLLFVCELIMIEPLEDTSHAVLACILAILPRENFPLLSQLSLFCGSISVCGLIDRGDSSRHLDFAAA